MKKWPSMLLALPLVLLGPQLACKPFPKLIRPGEIQPAAPGQPQAPPLPTLEWDGRPPEIRRVEYASNGHIEAAHALILVDEARGHLPDLLYLARQAVDGAFGCRAQLREVDVSIYRASDYGGFGGPPPILTVSVPRDRLHEFIQNGLQYHRLWSRIDLPHKPPQTPSQVRERSPVFHGSQAALQQQQESQQRGRAVHQNLLFHGRENGLNMALTFDDSPHPLYEPLLLDSLSRAQVRATFFCIGRNARAYPYFIRDMLEKGHEVANHTYHHVRLPGLKNSAVRQELRLANQTLEQISGLPCRLFRPPGGEYSEATLRMASELGLTTVFWTDDPGDFDYPGDRVIESRLLRNLRPGGIVLLHDNVQETIEILPEFVRLATRQGYRLETVSQLAQEK